ncbi:MAG: hypothetical protein IVW36_11970 [Dehalococcoidia bacterium]|nr:hypothetical protein [Dehalococcoidia bacterium]
MEDHHGGHGERAQTIESGEIGVRRIHSRRGSGRAVTVTFTIMSDRSANCATAHAPPVPQASLALPTRIIREAAPCVNGFTQKSPIFARSIADASPRSSSSRFDRLARRTAVAHNDARRLGRRRRACAIARDVDHSRATKVERSPATHVTGERHRRPGPRRTLPLRNNARDRGTR